MTTEEKNIDTSLDTDMSADAAALFEASRAVHEPRMVAFERGSDQTGALMVVPDRMKVVNVKPYLDAMRERPERAKGLSVHTTLDSLTAHAKRNGVSGSVAWLHVSGEAATLTVVYDYHEQLANASSGARPNWNEHGASYSFPLSEAWKTWRAKSGSAFSQPDFAAFIEARTEELAKPDDAGPLAMALASAIFDADGADDVAPEQARTVIATPGRLRGMAKKIALHVEERAEEQRDGNGTVTIVYRSEITEENPKGVEAGKLVRPQMFLVRLPVFQNGRAYVLPVRLSTKVSGGRVQWTFSLHRTDLALEGAQNDVAQAFTEATGLPVFRGTPEATPK